MHSEMGSTTGWMLVRFLGVLLFGVSVLPTCAKAQGAGNNAVYYYVSLTNTGQCCKGSSAFIDSSVFGGSSTNICGVLNSILASTSYPAAGAVIDARGLPGVGTSMTCTGSPWAGITNPPPSTILLPATAASAPIVIPTPWVLPNNTRLIGQGDNDPSSASPRTTIQASSSFSGNMIQFGSSSSSVCPSSVCTGISVENLTLDGQGGSINGIVNQYSQDFSYVDHVNLYQIRGYGLTVSTSANNSGPYSNITFDLGSYSGTTGTVCATINGLSGTHGIHSLTCMSKNSDPPAAVLLDSSNNSIEDVRIAGFYDGIRVGANANAQSNVLANIIGDTNPVLGGNTPINVVHITNLGHTVSDLSIMGANNATGGSSSTVTIQDDLTGAQLTDTSVGIYALGESPSSGTSYSRFTTSPSQPTWAVGTNYPQGSCARGSLYSCTGGSGSCTKTGSMTAYALWDCLPSTGWTGVM